MDWKRAKTVSFAILLGMWTYFRHYLNLVMLYSIWIEFDLMPCVCSMSHLGRCMADLSPAARRETSKRWSPKDGVWMVWWMKYQIFVPMFLLHLLNLFWYFLFWRVAYRAVFAGKLDDERSEDEGDDDESGDHGKEE
jgi:acyl-CoA-dependent ceramide synthase